MNLKQIKSRLKNVFSWLRHPGSSLSQKVIHGGIWVFAIRIVSRGFTLIRTIVLARLLAPNDFGLFGIAMLALTSLRAFSRTGFDQAIIQKKDDTKPYLNSAWTVQVIRGAVLASILIAGAPLVGAFFGEPRAVLLVRVLGIAELIKSFRNIGIVFFRKELEFHKQFVYRAGGLIADLAVALPAAFILRSVWALVFGLLAKNTVQTIMSFIVHSFRPSIEFNKEKIIELVDFGRWIMGSSILFFLFNQGDDIFVGRVIGTSALGLYQLAYRMTNVITTEFTLTVTKVLFPAYSKIQDDINKLKETYVASFYLTNVLIFLFIGLVFTVGPDFVPIVLGEKWSAMIPLLFALGICALSRTLNGLSGPVLRSLGRPDLITKAMIVNVTLLALLIYPFSVRWGVFGVALSVSIATLTGRAIQLNLTRKELKHSGVVFVKSIGPPLISALNVALVSRTLKLVWEIKTVYGLIGLSGGLVTVYFLSMAFFVYLTSYDVKEIVLKYRSKIIG